MSAPTGPTFRVDSQVETDQVTGQGQLVHGFNVAFTTGNGHSGTVFVPAAQYDVPTVKAKITELAAKMNAVGMITHETEV